MNKETIIGKIHKLMKLSKSPNSSEASAALLKAALLMEKYNVSMTEVELQLVKESSIGVKAVRPTDYQHHLGCVIASVFQCELYYHREIKTSVKFVGIDVYPELASYSYDVLIRKLEFARREFIKSLSKQTKRANKTRRANLFALGWVIGVSQVIEKMLPRQEVPAVVSTYLSEKKLVNTSARKVKSKGKRDNIDKINGYIQGSQETIHHGVKAGREDKILIGVAKNKENE